MGILKVYDMCYYSEQHVKSSSFCEKISSIPYNLI